MEAEVNAVAAAESRSGTPSAGRLVIRVKILPKESPRAPVLWRLSRAAPLLIAGAVAVLLLIWAGIGMFGADPTSAPAVTEEVSEKLPPKPATDTAETRSAEAAEPKPVESEVRVQPDAPPSPVNEVIPEVPRSARQTIRGTIRVSIRTIVDQEGKVLAAIADEPGPSRYFERLAVEASRKWTFTPTDSQEQRIVLVRFYFTRAGTKARASSLQ
jgi:TonB family protein